MEHPQGFYSLKAKEFLSVYTDAELKQLSNILGIIRNSYPQADIFVKGNNRPNDRLKIGVRGTKEKSTHVVFMTPTRNERAAIAFSSNPSTKGGKLEALKDKFGAYISFSDFLREWPVIQSILQREGLETLLAGEGLQPDDSTFDSDSSIIEKVAPLRLTDIEKSFRDDVKKTRQLPVEELRKKAAEANQSPKRQTQQVTVYKRNKYITALKLHDAAGKCQNRKCKSGANSSNNLPFTNSEGEVYLEVHHIIPLSKGGEDTLENTIALCPNCHREAHSGSPALEFQ